MSGLGDANLEWSTSLIYLMIWEMPYPLFSFFISNSDSYSWNCLKDSLWISGFMTLIASTSYIASLKLFGCCLLVPLLPPILLRLLVLPCFKWLESIFSSCRDVSSGKAVISFASQFYMDCWILPLLSSWHWNIQFCILDIVFWWCPLC